jgi:hypothetical protein
MKIEKRTVKYFLVVVITASDRAENVLYPMSQLIVYVINVKMKTWPRTPSKLSEINGVNTAGYFST